MSRLDSHAPAILRIRPVRGWAMVDPQGNIVTDTFVDLAGEQGRVACLAQTEVSQWADERETWQPVPVELRPLETAHTDGAYAVPREHGW